jgi:hypothetical protein
MRLHRICQAARWYPITVLSPLYSVVKTSPQSGHVMMFFMFVPGSSTRRGYLPNRMIVGIPTIGETWVMSRGATAQGSRLQDSGLPLIELSGAGTAEFMSSVALGPAPLAKPFPGSSYRSARRRVLLTLFLVVAL